MARLSSRNMFVDKNLTNTLRVKNVLHFMSMNIPPEYVDIEEFHDFWEIVYLESGEAEATADDNKIHLFPGDVIFHKPGEVHAIKALNDTVAKAFFLSFHSTNKETKFFESLKIALESEQKKMIHRLNDEAHEIYLNRKKHHPSVIFSSSALSPNAPTGAQQLFRIHLEEFLISVIRLVEKKENVITYESKDELERIIYEKMEEKIADSIYSTLSIDDLCSELNYGRTYLSILFKKNTGQSIMEYYNMLKIKEAKKLIMKGTHTLSGIAEMLKFGNQYYFSRVFKKFEGVSPTEYKESLK